MTRFSSLEFDDADKQPQRSDGDGVRNEAYFYKKAILSYLHGDFELGLRNYSRALEVNNLFLAGWAGQIRMLIELGEYKEAIVWSDKAMELFPEHPEFLSYKAIASFRDARFDKAMAFSDVAIGKDNPGPWAWLARAEILLKKNRNIAQTCIPKALACAGREAPLIRLEAGRILMRYRFYVLAMDFLSTAARDFPKSALAWLELGRCQRKLGNNQAKTTLEQCQTIRPQWDIAEKELAQMDKGFLSKIFGRLFSR
jgi:tetratricopeptide (TPR) repeat protein